MIIVAIPIWLVITLTGGYFINEAANDKLRNDIIETDLRYFNRAFKSIAIIQDLSKKIGVLLPLGEKKEIELTINKSDIKHIDGLKGVKVYDMDDNIMFQSVSDFTPSKQWKAIYAAKDFKIDAYSDNEIIMKISSYVHYADIAVGQAIIILSVPLPERVSAQLQTLYAVWLSVIIILFLLILLMAS